MLLTPRTYSLAQVPDAGGTEGRSSYFLLTSPRRKLQIEEQRVQKMLLLHQIGSVKVGEVVRYTVTYTPSEDRILPSPHVLHVRIRNTAAIPLRAAYLHGPYTLHISAYSSTFNPNRKVESPKQEGVPEFEPNLKAGGSWGARLTVPEHIREVGSNGEWSSEAPKSATWIIEVASQIIFSQSASIGYELLVARDERSLDLGFTAITGNSHGVPGQVEDHQQGKDSHVRKHPANLKGVYSKAIKLVVDDTTSLWNKPELPVWKKEETQTPGRKSREFGRKSKDLERRLTEEQIQDKRKQKKIHLVVLTHGLHSNLGADMLYLKESIDAAAKQARDSRRKRRQVERGTGIGQDASAQRHTNSQSSGQNGQDGQSGQELHETSTAPLSGGQDRLPDEDAEEDEEEVIVRGFNKNVIRTERGIQYLGKRLAKYVLQTTYPDQPFLPIKKSKFTPFSPTKDKADAGTPAHSGSSIQHPKNTESERRAYRFTSISFIGHSLGGLVQTYAIAYIQKHSPTFFDVIKPINFITMASPFLGMSNENPMYVKFALDFGLVGRTGQDLGLTWRAPTLARSGWTAMVSGFGSQSQNQSKQNDPGAKPLLRILPTGPAHIVLRKFRNRTVYSNVVNDGIVPLRTSCLLFLDWRGLGKVEKAMRENGLITKVAVWGYGQLTGQNTSPNPSRVDIAQDDEETDMASPDEGDTVVPQPDPDAVEQDDKAQAKRSEPADGQWLNSKRDDTSESAKPAANGQNTLMTLWGYIRPSGKHTSKDRKMFKRSQTIGNLQDDESEASQSFLEQNKRPQATRGDSIVDDPTNSSAPPKTTIFESAGDLISPPVPPTWWIIDPSKRNRAIFHDRVYHPEDIPPPPTKKKNSNRSVSSGSNSSQYSVDTIDEGGMRVEEKIARAYHRDLSWRKVLVRLEPDAHNNIVVRRMFANAYGWPVVKHVCDTHFADTFSAVTRDELEPTIDRAKDVNEPVLEDGEHVKGQEDPYPPIERTESEMREVADELAPLKLSHQPNRGQTNDSVRSKDSGVWDDLYFEGTSDDDDEDYDNRNAFQKFLQLPQAGRATSPTSLRTPVGEGTSDAEIADFLSSSPRQMDVHRGLGASPTASRPRPASRREPDSTEFIGSNVLGKGRQTTSPTHTPSASVAGLGIRSLADVSSSSSPTSKGSDHSGGVAEQVARMSSRDEN